MFKKTSLMAYIFVLVFSQGAEAVQNIQAADSGASQQEIRPDFPYKDGWLGGDAAYSVQFASNQSLWLFGDSFVGDSKARSRAGSKLVRNSVGISSYDDTSGWSIKYFWKRKGKSDPKAFFEPKEGTGYFYWPMDGFQAGENLYVALSRVRNVEKGGPFDFEITGVDLACISNYTLPPEKWEIEYVELHAGTDLFPGVSISVIGQHAYFYTLFDDKTTKRRPVLLERIPIKRLSQPTANLEYYSKDHKWKRGFDAQDAEEVFPTGNTEMSVRYHEDSRKWVAISGPAYLSNKILISAADALTGPWSEWQTFYEVPELKGANPDIFCYAGKEHFEFYQPNKRAIEFTYVCNSSKFEKLISNMSIYRPIPLYLTLPALGR
jgi:hypothetical protein